MDQQGVQESAALQMAKERLALEQQAANPKSGKGVVGATQSTLNRLSRRSLADRQRDERLDRNGGGNIEEWAAKNQPVGKMSEADRKRADRWKDPGIDRLKDLPAQVNKRATNGTPIQKEKEANPAREQGNYFDRLIAATTAIERKLASLEAV